MYVSPSPKETALNFRSEENGITSVGFRTGVAPK